MKIKISFSILLMYYLLLRATCSTNEKEAEEEYYDDDLLLSEDASMGKKVARDLQKMSSKCPTSYHDVIDEQQFTCLLRTMNTILAPNITHNVFTEFATNPRLWKRIKKSLDLVGVLILSGLPQKLGLHVPHKKFKKLVEFFAEDTICAMRSMVYQNSLVPDDTPVDYFLSDLGANWQHFLWHIYFRFRAQKFRPDRRGELLGYFHHEILARFNGNRLANGMPMVGEFPFEGVYAIRNDFLKQIFGRGLVNPNEPDYMVMADRLVEAASSGFLLAQNGTFIDLDSYYGVDMFGDAVEASQWSINPEYYGQSGLHNAGHVIIGTSTVDGFMKYFRMLLFNAAMKESIFYPYHQHFDNLFLEIKNKHAPYRITGGDFPLLWPGIVILNVQTWTRGYENQANQFRTYFSMEHLNPAGFERCNDRGVFMLDEVYVGQMLDHCHFIHKITVMSDRHAKATVRIFMAPHYNVQGIRMTLDEQRTQFMVLDIFTYHLNQGLNVITRRSNESSVTLNWRLNLDDMRWQMMCEVDAGRECLCGWPHNLIIPKGTPNGIPYDFFVMLTDGDYDTSHNDGIDMGTPEMGAWIFCGTVRKKYPDIRPMGYPFDRLPHPNPSEPAPVTIEDFASVVPNMISTQVLIIHDDSKSC